MVQEGGALVKGCAKCTAILATTPFIYGQFCNFGGTSPPSPSPHSYAYVLAVFLY